jgi:hypothetical protein
LTSNANPYAIHQEEAYLQEAIRQSLKDEMKPKPEPAPAPDLLDFEAPPTTTPALPAAPSYGAVESVQSDPWGAAPQAGQQSFTSLPAITADAMAPGALVLAAPSSGYGGYNAGGPTNPYANSYTAPYQYTPPPANPYTAPAPAPTNPYGVSAPAPAVTNSYGAPASVPATTNPPTNPYGAPVAANPHGAPAPVPASTNPYGAIVTAPASANPYGAPVSANLYGAPSPVPVSSNPYATTVGANPYGAPAPASSNPYGAPATANPYGSFDGQETKSAWTPPAPITTQPNPYDSTIPTEPYSAFNGGPVPPAVTPHMQQTPSSLGFGSPLPDFTGFSPSPVEKAAGGVDHSPTPFARLSMNGLAMVDEPSNSVVAQPVSEPNPSDIQSKFAKLASLDNFSVSSNKDSTRSNPFESSANSTIGGNRSLADMAKNKVRHVSFLIPFAEKFHLNFPNGAFFRPNPRKK